MTKAFEKKASSHQRIEESIVAASDARCTLATSHRIARPTARAFTLTEMLVAVAVLVIVIAGTSKIFGTASKVTGISQANQDVLAEAAAIEAQIREDISRLSHEGFFAIHNVAVSNDINGAALLNPNLPPTAIIRADQLLFFASGVENTQTFYQAAGSNHKAQGTVSRVYYGHGFQLPRGLPVQIPNPAVNRVNAHDPDVQAAGPITPWWVGPVNMVRTEFATGNAASGAGSIYRRTTGGTIDGTQPQARKWLFCRQSVPLLDDDDNLNNDNSKASFLNGAGTTGALTARSIFVDSPPLYGAANATPREIRNGRVDASAMLLNEIRRWVTFTAAAPRQWGGIIPGPTGGSQSDVIRSSVYYPRAERIAPSTHRVDQALTNSVISSACSSFIVDWTYDGGGTFDASGNLVGVDANGNIKGGSGEVLDTLGNVRLDSSGSPYLGVFMRSDREHIWFGLPFPDADSNGYSDDRGVRRYGGAASPQYSPASAVFANNIESQVINTSTVKDYWALFGFNQDRPLDATGNPNATLGFTPWPTALRITMVLHDPAGKLEAGREVQFIIDLPRRSR